MRLSPKEETFLRHWMYEEMHYLEGSGPAKHLQLVHTAKSADLATLIAAAFPDLADQEAADMGPPPAVVPTWPWSGDELSARVAEARAHLAQRQRRSGPDPVTSCQGTSGEARR